MTGLRRRPVLVIAVVIVTAAAAVLALLGGADGITVHLREDRRHIQDRDVRLLRLYEGTSEIQRLVIARSILGLTERALASG